MKNINKLLLVFAAGALASCADDGVADYPVDPNFLEQQAAKEYLNNYESLKSYKSNANLKVGAAVDAQEIAEKGGSYIVAQSNFDEVEPNGNTMTHGGVFVKDGTSNFATIEKLVASAADAGLTVYGHAIAWHAQQQVQYLTSVVAEKPVPQDPNAGGFEIVKDITIDHTKNTEFPYYCMSTEKEFTFFNDGLHSKSDEGWYQYFAGDGVPWQVGKKYTVTAMISCTKEGSIDVNCGNWGTAVKNSLKVSPEMKESSFTFEMPEGGDGNGFIIFQLAGFAGEEVHLKYLEVTHEEGVAGTVDVEVQVTEERTCFEAKSQDMVEVSWETQAWIEFPGVEFKEGDSWEISMDVKAAKEASAGTQIHAAAGDYLHWEGVGTVSFTTEWETFTATGTFNAEQDVAAKKGTGVSSITFNLNDYDKSNTYFFDNISFKLNGTELVKNGECDPTKENVNFKTKEAPSTEILVAPLLDKITYTTIKASNTIPQTPEELKAGLSNAMRDWIKGLMTATEGKVKAWTVVNEPLSENDKTAEGFYAMQHGSNPEANGVDGQNFFWQDCMGDIDYVRVAVDTTRKYFQGDAKELKLFVNETNLVNADKAKSLLHWIGKWENETVKIDGIATTLNLSCAANNDKQLAAVEAMFKTLASSGKLVKVSLDMNCVDNKGNVVSSLTDDQSKAMSDLYQSVIKSYLANVPAQQQYGITLVSINDANGSTAGLWDANFSRKDSYAGFCEGLQAK